MGLAHVRIINIGQSCDLELLILDAHALLFVREGDDLAVVAVGDEVVVRALVRCLSRKRDSTSMVMLAEAQPRKSTPWKNGTRNEIMGKPVSGLIEGSVTASVLVTFAA